MSETRIWKPSLYPREPWDPQPADFKCFAWVSPGCVARCNQPSRRGYEWLVEQGFKAALSLRGEGYPSIPAPLLAFHSPWVDEEAPPANGASDVIRVALDPANWPLAIFCHAGRGRTSCAAGALRHWVDGWRFAQVMEEVRDFRIVARPLGIPVRWPLARVQRDWLRDYCGEAG